MNAFFGIVVVRVIIVIGGILATYWGYRLFYITSEKMGDLSLKSGSKHSISLKDVAPGVFFALFGALVLICSLLKPMSYSSYNNGEKIVVKSGNSIVVGNKQPAKTNELAAIWDGASENAAGVAMEGSAPGNPELEYEPGPIERIEFETDVPPEQDGLIPSPHQ
mgnify:CR=1 FL=1